MIEALCSLNEKLTMKLAEYPRYGQTQVSSADTVICLSRNGKIVDIMSLVREHKEANGKSEKTRPSVIVPYQRPRSGTSPIPYFLCDTSEYILGFKVNNDGKLDLSLEKFKSSAEFHKKLLASCSSDCAKAIINFYDNWIPDNASDNDAVKRYLKSFKGNLLFRIDNVDALCDQEIWNAWDLYYRKEKTSNITALCPIKGCSLPVSDVHARIKNVPAAQSAGAALVSFNNASLESFGMERNENSKISDEAAFEYTTALNYLLADKSSSSFRIGDSIYVCWADTVENAYSVFFNEFFSFSNKINIDWQQLQVMLKQLTTGCPITFDETNLSPDTSFYVLGLYANNARIAVTHYSHNNFGRMLKNIELHYHQLEIVGLDKKLFPERILKETISSDTNDMIPEWMASSFLSSIINGTRYPDSVYFRIVRRVLAEKNVKDVRVAFIKAYLMRNNTNSNLREVLSVDLNYQSDYQPYVLGRIFAVLERIQSAANGASTIKDRFFDSACATPSIAFPSIFLLTNRMLNILERDKPGLAVYFKGMIEELVSKLEKSFPTHLSLEEQGTFIIGYYHQISFMDKKKEASNDN